MIFWNSINEGHRKILSIMHTNGSCIASTYHTYQHYIVSGYSLYSAPCVWICFSFIFQQFYGVFFTHDQIECTLTKWTQRMTVMKWSFVFLLFGCVHCLLALNPWLISYCYFFVVHLMGDILNGTWADPMVDRHIQCASANIYPLFGCVYVFFICYLLMRHPKEERVYKTMHTQLMQTQNIYTIFCAPIVHLIHITLYHRIVSTQLFLLSVYIYCITLTDLNFISLHCYIIRTAYILTEIHRCVCIWV